MMDLFNVHYFHIPPKIGLLLCVVYLMTLLITLPIALNDWIMPSRNGESTKRNLRQDSQCMLLGHGHVFGHITEVHSWCHCSASHMESVYLDKEI